MTTLLYDGAALIETVRNQARVPDVDSVGTTDNDILRYLNEELMTKMMPSIIRVREEYITYTEQRPLVANQTRYRLDRRAAGQAVRDVFFINDTSTGIGTGVRRHLRHIQRELRGRYSSSPASRPIAYFLEWNHINLVPDVDGAAVGKLELSYHFRPSEIVLIDETARIQAVNTTTGVITLTATPPTAFVANVDYDVHSPFSGSDIRVFDITASAVDTVLNTVTFTASDIDETNFGTLTPQVGDFLALAGESAIPFLPRELHPTLAKAAATILLKNQGDSELAAIMTAEVDSEIALAIETYLEQRVEGDPQTITNQFSFVHRGSLWGTGRANEF